MPDLKSDLKGFLLKSKRTAMLVIHGIGEQNPYETLDNFARNLASFFDRECGYKLTITPEKIEHDDWVEVCIHLSNEDHGPQRQRGEIDLYEYYWAPCTEDKITYRETLWWLARTTFNPLRYFAVNLAVQSNEGKVGTAKVFIRELFRILFIYLPLLFALGLGALWYGQQGTNPIKEFLGSVQKWAQQPHIGLVVLSLLFFALSAFLLVYAVRSLPKGLSKKRCIQARAELTWIILAGTIGIALAFAGWLTGIVFNFNPFHTPNAIARDLLGQVFGLFSPLRLLGVNLPSEVWGVPIPTGTPILALLLVWLWFNLLQKYLGDVAVYVNTDQKAKNYAARVQILNGSTAALMRLLKAKIIEQGKERLKYDEVILVGHSLGSVISYDTIDELVNHAEATREEPGGVKADLGISKDELEKLTGLVTFGSPLDKIYYFFRQQVRSDQAVRAQILSYLHAFRKVRSNRDYGEYAFPRYEPFEPKRLRWLNAWSVMDMVSGKLSFYRVDHRQHFWYWAPLLAHLSYWGDPKFYRFVAENLLLAEEAAPAAKAAAGSDIQ
jgi:hypothetical protein